MAQKSGKKYPGVKGKVVQFAEHSFAKADSISVFDSKTKQNWAGRSIVP